MKLLNYEYIPIYLHDDDIFFVFEIQILYFVSNFFIGLVFASNLKLSEIIFDSV